MLCNAVDDVLDGLGGGRGGVAAGMALKLAKKDKTAGLRRQPVDSVTNELTCGITRSHPVRSVQTESSPKRESADALSAGTWPKTGQNRALAARARQGKPNQEESRTCERANSCDTKYHVSAASAPWNCARETAEGGVSGPCAEGCQASQGDASSHPSLSVSWGGAHRG